MASDRVLKFWDDCQTVVTSKNYQKIQSEVSRLKTWIQKHQDEAIPDGSKSKLMMITEKYYLFILASPHGISESLKDLVTALLSDLLAIPEGKLISAKSKSRLLKWIGVLVSNDSEAKISTSSNEVTSEWTVMEVSDDNRVSLISMDGEEVLEGVMVPDINLMGRIRVCMATAECDGVVVLVTADIDGEGFTVVHLDESFE